ncbi:MAG: DUF5361 domain-containing protein [Rhodococcus sp. (in: high G+C Gram-positive bacteria)]|uniref:DUF5361 domain-containing protein n=1 Tax=Rhodococcus sp. TaxID=1831 RepID=UPI003BB4F29D
MGVDHDWSELKAVVKQSLRDPHSSLFFAIAPDDAGWGKLEQLLAELVDTAHWVKWSKTTDAKFNRNHPKPIPRPGVVKPERIGEDPIPMDEMDEWLGWTRKEVGAS